MRGLEGSNEGAGQLNPHYGEEEVWQGRQRWEANGRYASLVGLLLGSLGSERVKELIKRSGVTGPVLQTAS